MRSIRSPYRRPIPCLYPPPIRRRYDFYDYVFLLGEFRVLRFDSYAGAVGEEARRVERVAGVLLLEFYINPFLPWNVDRHNVQTELWIVPLFQRHDW